MDSRPNRRNKAALHVKISCLRGKTEINVNKRRVLQPLMWSDF